MKKVCQLPGFPILPIAAILFFGSCQKDQATVNPESNTSAEKSSIVGISSNGVKFNGSVSASYADALQQNFKNEYRNKNQSYQVAFNAKELAEFIRMLQNTEKSEWVFVNFGLYGKDAPAPDPKDNGRMTVFFTGNNITLKNSGNTQTNGTSDGQDGSQYLNHGNIYP